MVTTDAMLLLHPDPGPVAKLACLRDSPDAF